MTRVFLSHSNARPEVTEVFYWALYANGFDPVVVERRPSLGLPPDKKVQHYLDQCDVAVVLATSDPEVPGRTRPNIQDELGRIGATLGDKVVLFVEEGVDMPSNVTTTWHQLDSRDLRKAIDMMRKEFSDMGFPPTTPRGHAARGPSKSGIEIVKWEDKRPLNELLPQHKAVLVVAYTFASVTGDEAMWKKWVEDGGRLHVVLPDFRQDEILMGANLTTALAPEHLRQEWDRATGFLRDAQPSWQGEGGVELRLVLALPSVSLAVLYRRQSIDEGRPGVAILKTPRPRRGQEHVRVIEVHFDGEPEWCEALAEYAQKYWRASTQYV